MKNKSFRFFLFADELFVYIKQMKLVNIKNKCFDLFVLQCLLY